MTFSECKSNIHVIKLITQDFSHISYQCLVNQQRNQTRGFVDSLKNRRRLLSIPPVSADDPPGVILDDKETNGDRCKKNNNLIHDAFMYSSNIFSGNGFGSNPCAFAAVAEMNIRSNFDAHQDINLTELIPCTAWF